IPRRTHGEVDHGHRQYLDSARGADRGQEHHRRYEKRGLSVCATAARQAGLASTASEMAGYMANALFSPVILKISSIRGESVTSISEPSCTRTRRRLPTRAPRPVESRNSTSRK